MSDNYQFHLAAEGLDKFEIIMRLAFSPHATSTPHIATHYEVCYDYGLVLYDLRFVSDPNKDLLALPYPMDVEAAIPFAWNWLKTAKYPPQPDHDGSNHKGFEVFNEAWGRVGDRRNSFVAIKPEWQMYGK